MIENVFNYQKYRIKGLITTMIMISKQEGEELNSDYIEIDGRTYRIDQKTGELIEQVWICGDIGSRLIPPGQQNGMQKKKKDEEKKKLHRARLSALGRDYFFIDRLHDFRSLKNQTVARLIYLASFLPGGSALGSNQLFITRKRPLTKNDLLWLLGLKSRHARDSFLRDAADYIFVESDGSLYLNRYLFIRGYLSKQYQELQRAFVTGVRCLYENTSPNRHRLLGLVFKAIPYLNMEFNILCENPEETSFDAIRPLSVKQFCNIIDYDYSEVYRLKEELAQIRFPVNEKMELFCTFIPCSEHAKQTRIMINPHIMYCGSDYEKVEILGRFRAEWK